MKTRFSPARSFCLLVFGLCFGYFVPKVLHRAVSISKPNGCSDPSLLSYDPYGSGVSHVFPKKQLIFVGVMTAEKFLNTRAKAVYETWGKALPGTLMFFSSNTSRHRDLPVVSLPGVDDSYPPQRKSMMMLKYMHDNFIDKYEWFLRADDDVYIRSDKLEKFLRTFNSSDDLFVGQAGTGTVDEKGILGLGWGDNYCMGGPGMILSSSTLRKVTPYLEHCLQNLRTTHEDVEVGRCIKLYVGISCTWAFEMQSLFYHNRSGIHAFTNNLDTKAVRNAVTLHPLKKASYMYRMHTHMMEVAIQERMSDAVLLQRRLKAVDRLLESQLKDIPEEELVSMNDEKDFNHEMLPGESPDWEMFTARKVYSSTTNVPEIGMINPMKDGMNLVLGQTMAIINKEARKVLHRTLEFKRLNHGYKRFHPMYGMQYMLDLLMKYHRHIGRNRRRMTVHVRHHAYLQQPFGNLLYTIEPDASMTAPVNFVLPLAGRLAIFSQFLQTYERVCLLADGHCTLVIVYFKEVSPSSEHRDVYQALQRKYPKASLSWIDMGGAFSRSLGLTFGAQRHSSRSLLFFCDVDVEFDANFLSRCRANAKIGKQVYYPMVFSQFNPKVAYYKEFHPNSTFYFSKDSGFWRQYGFGIACMYHYDFDHIGGFDTTIQGWGLEDVNLYDRFVSSANHTVFRSADPGLVHIYHDATCDPNLAASQKVMCVASQAQTYGSQRKLYEIVSERLPSELAPPSESPIM